MRRRLKISSSILSLCVAVGLVAACGDSGSDNSSSSTTTAAATGAAGEPSAVPTTSVVAPPSSGTSGSAGVPAITSNATDLTKEPIIATGGATPPNQLVIADLVTGQGTAAVASDTVDVQYTGALYSNGTVFDGTWKNGGRPTTFSLAEVVPGFTQGIAGMKPGGRREIVIPPALGYGTETNGPIPGGSTLVFVVDLVGIS